MYSLFLLLIYLLTYFLSYLLTHNQTFLPSNLHAYLLIYNTTKELHFYLLTYYLTYPLTCLKNMHPLYGPNVTPD